MITQGINKFGWIEVHKTVFNATLNGKPIILKVFSKKTYHSYIQNNFEEFKKEFEMLMDLNKHGVALQINGLYSIPFGTFKSKLKDGYELPSPVKFHGDHDKTIDPEHILEIEDIPPEEIIYFYIMEKCDEFEFNEDIRNDLIELFTIMDIMVSNELYHGDIQFGNIVRCNGKIKLIDPLPDYPPTQAYHVLQLDDFNALKNMIRSIDGSDPQEPWRIVGGEGKLPFQVTDSTMKIFKVETVDDLYQLITLLSPKDYGTAIEKLKQFKSIRCTIK